MDYANGHWVKRWNVELVGKISYASFQSSRLWQAFSFDFHWKLQSVEFVDVWRPRTWAMGVKPSRVGIQGEYHMLAWRSFPILMQSPLWINSLELRIPFSDLRAICWHRSFHESSLEVINPKFFLLCIL